VWLRDLPGVLSAEQLDRTVASVAAASTTAARCPGRTATPTPWDHVECAMALTLGGRLDEARAAYAWLRRTQEADGAWRMKYEGESVLDASVDTNQVAYVAVGVWQWWTVTGDRSLVDVMWPHVRSALDFVLDHQAPGGQLYWSRGPGGRVDRDALLTGSSSAYQALRCGIALAELVGEPQPEWELGAGLLQHAVAQHPEVFLDKTRFSMDWYYPVLGGAVRGEAARSRLEERWDEFVVAGVGCRCVADRPWVTGAETAELVLTLAASGRGRARGAAADRGAAPARAGRLVLDRAGLRRGRPLAGRALVLDGRRRGSGRRRAGRGTDAGPVPGRQPADRRAAARRRLLRRGRPVRPLRPGAGPARRAGLAACVRPAAHRPRARRRTPRLR
jgi:hypothetical protein